MKKITLLALSILLAVNSSAVAREAGLNEAEQLFQSATQLYQESTRDKTAALEAFERFLKRFPDSTLVGDAQFMVGESYLAQALTILRAEASSKKTSSARLMAPKNQAALEALQNAKEAYKEVISRSKKSGLASSAQYRLGETAYNMKDWGNAVEEFRAVEKNYPKAYLVPESWMGVVFADIALEQFSQAESNLFMLGETYPNFMKLPEVLYAQGIIALHKSDYPAAEKSLRQVKTAEALFYLGKTYLLSKRPFLAATAFESLVRDYSTSELKEQADFFIGDSFFLAKDFDGAITKYQRFLDKYPESQLKVAAMFRIGSAHFQKQNFVDARANFQSVLDKYPQDFFAPLSQYFIAESYLVANQMREALFAYTKVITQFPDTVKISPLAHYKLAWTQYQVGDFAQTVQTSQNFIALYPTHALAKNVYLIMGNALVGLKRYSEAVTSWQRIIDLAPTSEVAEQALFSILQAQHQLRNFDSILTSYQFIFRHLPPSQSKWRSMSYLYAAEAYLAMNQVDEAQAIYEMILKVYPNDPAAFYAQDGLAWAYAMRGEDEKAVEERHKLKEMLTVSRSTYIFTSNNELGIADSMYNQKNYEDAYNLYDKFVKENPQSPQAPNALYRAGMSLYNLRYYTQAIEMWQKLAKDYPKAKETPQAAYQTADTLFLAQKYGEATKAYKQIIEDYPRSKQITFAYLRIAQAAFNGKDDAGTIQNALALIQRFPKEPEAVDALDLMDGAYDRKPQLDFQEGFREVEKAHRGQSIAGDAIFRLAQRLYQKKDYKRAAAEFQNFSVDYTGNSQLPKAQYLLAASFFNGNGFQEAVPAFQRFLNNFPRSEDTEKALFLLGSAHYNLKQYGMAAEQYQRLLEEFPDSEFMKQTQLNLAMSLKSMGKLDSAQEAYNKYIRTVGTKDANGLLALWDLFSIQKDRKDYETAMDTLRQIQTASPSGENALEAAYRLGETSLLMRRPDEAVNHWEKLRELRPAGNAFRLQGLVKLGELYEKTDLPRAIAVYEDLGRTATNQQMAAAARHRANELRGGKGIKKGGADSGNGGPPPKKKSSGGTGGP